MNKDVFISQDGYLSHLKQRVNGKRVAVGVSGGVDSSVSALLLKEMGANVTGMFIRSWYPDFVECSWKDDREDAMRLCAFLKIPFKEINLSKEYEKNVVSYLLSEYKRGRTPNPDIMCNKYIKFGSLFDEVMKYNYDYFATGHYAKSGTIDSPLHCAYDEQKDQTYFLWASNKESLQSTLFPLGSLLKSEVRRRASQGNLPTATRRESQGICFMGEIDMHNFLSHYFSLERGNVLDISGNIIGYHEGVIPLTLGQATGFTIIKKTNNDEKMVIISKDIEYNTITVVPQSTYYSSSLMNNQIHIEQVNILSDISDIDENITVRIRHRGEKIPVQSIIDKKDNSFMITTHSALHNPTPGQSAVLYKNDVVIGGGIIL